jgi:proline iminopeptidase
VALSSLDREVMLHFFARIAPTYDLRPRLSGVALPTLVMVGEEDWVTPPIGSRIIAESIPGAILVVLRGAGHFGFSEVPDAFRSTVRSFLATLPAADDEPTMLRMA